MKEISDLSLIECVCVLKYFINVTDKTLAETIKQRADVRDTLHGFVYFLQGHEDISESEMIELCNSITDYQYSIILDDLIDQLEIIE